MKVKKSHDEEIATSLLDMLKSLSTMLIIITVLNACGKKDHSLLMVLSWLSWLVLLGCFLNLRFELLLSECVSLRYGYKVPFVLRVVYNVLLAAFLIVFGLFVLRASQAKVLSDVVSTLTGPLYDNALASVEIRMTVCNALEVMRWMLAALFCYSMLLAAQLLVLLRHAGSISSSKSVNSNNTSTAEKDKARGGTKNALLDV